MQKYSIYRIGCHALVLYLQTTNYIDTQRKINDALPTHPELQELASLMSRYFTLWNLLVQVIYAFVALLCDVTSLIKMESLVPAWIRYHRFTIYSSLFFPMGVIVSLFWPFFIYDRNLIFPERYDIVVSKTCNFLWHAAVIFYIFWELAFLPRNIPKSPAGIKVLLVCNFGYLLTLLYTRYVDLSIWPYGILNALEGTIYLHIFISFVMIAFVLNYFLQWRLRAYIWRLRDKKYLATKNSS